MHPVQRYRHRVYGRCHNAVDSAPDAISYFRDNLSLSVATLWAVVI